MTEEVTFVTRGTGATPITVNATSVSWPASLTVHRFSPATLAIVGEFLGEAKIPNIAVNFGKAQEDVVFTVQFDTDDDWKAFRTFWLKTAYYDYTLVDGQRVYKKGEIEFFWGKSGDAFYSGEDDIYTGNDGKYVGIIQSVTPSRDFAGKFWKADIKIMIIGAVV